MLVTLLYTVAPSNPMESGDGLSPIPAKVEMEVQSM